MNYIGSKYKLLSFIKNSIYSVVGTQLDNKIFCDLFAGTGIVGRSFKKEVKKIISNDIEYYSYVLNQNYIGNHKEFSYTKLIEEINNTKLIDNGFIYQNYCVGSGSKRQYFSDLNGKKIDSIRIKIQKWLESKTINKKEFYFLLASLLESADKVANTASVYGAFLKNLKKTAAKEMILTPALFEINNNGHEVYNEDSNELIKHIKGDVLYLDPPYNARQYGANYHILNTIAQYDNFEPIGKTGIRNYYRSSYCKKNEVKITFENLIRNADFKYIFLSYNNEGLMSGEFVKNIMKKYGRYELMQQKYQRFKSDNNINRNHKADSTFEYLHVLEKR